MNVRYVDLFQMINERIDELEPIPDSSEEERIKAIGKKIKVQRIFKDENRIIGYVDSRPRKRANMQYMPINFVDLALLRRIPNIETVIEYVNMRFSLGFNDYWDKRNRKTGEEYTPEELDRLRRSIIHLTEYYYGKKAPIHSRKTIFRPDGKVRLGREKEIGITDRIQRRINSQANHSEPSRHRDIKKKEPFTSIMDVQSYLLEMLRGNEGLDEAVLQNVINKTKSEAQSLQEKMVSIPKENKEIEYLTYYLMAAHDRSPRDKTVKAMIKELETKMLFSISRRYQLKDFQEGLKQIESMEEAVLGFDYQISKRMSQMLGTAIEQQNPKKKRKVEQKKPERTGKIPAGIGRQTSCLYLLSENAAELVGNEPGEDF